MTKITVDKALIEQALEAAFSPYCTQDLAILVPALRAALAEPAVEPVAVPEHWSDCATNNEPAYPAGACDCMPTHAMCRAAVEYMNGTGVYEKVAREALDIEESIYREVWIAMQAASPPPPAEPAVEPISCQWLAEMIMADLGYSSNDSRMLAKITERIVDYDRSNAPPPPAEVPLLTDAQLDTVCQWFNCVQDTNVEYLEQHDYALAKEIYERLGRRVPISIDQAVRQNAGLK